MSMPHDEVKEGLRVVVHVFHRQAFNAKERPHVLDTRRRVELGHIRQLD